MAIKAIYIVKQLTSNITGEILPLEDRPIIARFVHIDDARLFAESATEREPGRILAVEHNATMTYDVFGRQLPSLCTVRNGTYSCDYREGHMGLHAHVYASNGEGRKATWKDRYSEVTVALP